VQRTCIFALACVRQRRIAARACRCADDNWLPYCVRKSAAKVSITEASRII